jgi:hypothetical protein
MEARDLTFDRLQEEVEKLFALLKDRQPGLMSWHALLNERLSNLRAMLDMAGYGRNEPQEPSVFVRMLASCKFGWVNDNITPENFLITEEPEDGTEYVLVHLSKVTSTDEAEAEVKKLGLELANLADLLLYVRKNLDKQREFPIVALGVRWRSPHGSWFSPYASDWYGKRYLDLDYRENDWNGNYRFLARKPR